MLFCGERQKEMGSRGKYSALAAAVCLQLCVGIFYVWSIFQGPVMKYCGWTSGEASTTFYIMLAVNLVGMIAGGRINYHKGPRFAVTLGWVIFVSGLFLSSLVPGNMGWLFYITHGGITAFGIGICYITVISFVQRWWPGKKGLASGITVAAYGLATVVQTPILNWLLSDRMLGVSGTFRVLCLAFCAVFLMAVWFVKNPPEGYTESSKYEVNQTIKQLSPRQIVKTKAYYLVLICFFCFPPAYYILNPLFKLLGEARGLQEPVAVASVMITGIANVLGRFTAPALSDCVGVKKVFYMLFAIMFTSSLLMAFAQGILFIVLIALISYAYGGWAGIIPCITVELFGARHLESNYGMVMISPAIAGLVFPAAANALSSGGQPGMFSFILPAAGCIIGLIVSMHINFARSCEGAPSPQGMQELTENN